MPLSDFFPQMKDWQSVSAQSSQKPSIPDPQTQSTPNLRAPLPLPLQYSPDTLKQYNRPGLSAFRITPTPPSGLPAINSAASSVAQTTVIETINSSAAGPNGAIQFNNGGFLGGVSQLEWINGSSTLSLIGVLSITGSISLVGTIAASVFNATTGFQVGGAAPAGGYLRGNGTDFVSSLLLIGDFPTTGTWPFAGTISGNTIFSGTPVFNNVPTFPTQSANTFYAGPASGPAAVPTFRSIVSSDIPSGTVPWNSIGSATGALTLNNTGFATTFEQNSATILWTWANITAATGGANQSTPQVELQGQYWDGSSTQSDSWIIRGVLGTGSNPTSALTLTHSGSSGIASVQIPETLIVTSGLGTISNRFLVTGTPQVSGNIVLSAGWGATAAVSAVSGYDGAMIFTVTAAGAGLAANPTITITYADGTWGTVPAVLAQQTGGTGAINFVTVTTPSATAPVLTWNGAPSNGLTYIFTVVTTGIH